MSGEYRKVVADRSHPRRQTGTIAANATLQCRRFLLTSRIPYVLNL